MFYVFQLLADFHLGCFRSFGLNLVLGKPRLLYRSTVMHPIETVPGLKQSIRLIKSESLPELPIPWPRQQDVSPTVYNEPSKDDLVLSVSHTWHFQAHPDPLGEKLKSLQQAIDNAKEKPDAIASVF